MANSWSAFSFPDKGKDRVEHDSLVCSSCRLSKIVAYTLNDHITTNGAGLVFAVDVGWMEQNNTSTCMQLYPWLLCLRTVIVK